MLERSAKYKKIGEKLIRTLPELEYIKNSNVKIAYLVSDEMKTKNRKTILADCNKVNPRYSWCCKYDFFIVVYEQNIPTFTEEQRITLMRHELRHVGIDTDRNEPSFYVVPHDIEDFYSIIEDEGLRWNE